MIKKKLPTGGLCPSKFKWKHITSLIGQRVKEVREFDNGHFDSGFLIFFEDGTVLTAQDGEYGDNTFRFIPIAEAREQKVYKNSIAGTL